MAFIIFEQPGGRMIPAPREVRFFTARVYQRKTADCYRLPTWSDQKNLPGELTKIRSPQYAGYYD